MIRLAITAFLMVLGLTVPASAHTPSYYLALGDSIATGRQAVPVSPNQGYVARLHRDLSTEYRSLRLVNIACDGETSASMRDGGRCEYRSGSQTRAALDFLRTHRGRVEVITITMGGNDVAPCAGAAGVDRACVANALTTITTDLAQTMKEIRAAAPGVTIVGMTLYDPFLAAWLSGPEGQELARQSIPVTQTINNAITDVYRAVDARVADVEDSFYTTNLTTVVDGLPKGVAMICRWTTTCQVPSDIHPNSEGYEVIAQTYRPLVSDHIGT